MRSCKKRSRLTVIPLNPEGTLGVGSYYQDSLVTSMWRGLDILSRTVLVITTHPSVWQPPCKPFKNY